MRLGWSSVRDAAWTLLNRKYNKIMWHLVGFIRQLTKYVNLGTATKLALKVCLLDFNLFRI